MPGRPLVLTAWPSTWSSISAITPPWTSPGGPSYGAPRLKSLHALPFRSLWMWSGGATGLRRPMTVLPQLRPRLPSGAEPDAVRAGHLLLPEPLDDGLDLDLRGPDLVGSTSVRMVTSTSSRTASVNGA